MQRLRGLLLLSLFAVLRPLVFAEDYDDFVMPEMTSRNVEYYDHGEMRCAIYLEKTPFNEAYEICLGQNGSLLELIDENLAKFIGRALAESAVSFGTLWIGGKFFPGDATEDEGEWKWIKSGEIIESKLDNVTHFPMTEPPYWVDRPSNKAKEDRCVATDRQLHQRPLIVDLPCTMWRPFICNRVAEVAKDPEENKPPVVTTTNKTYHIFFAQSTWEEALGHCSQYDMKLAKLTKKEEFIAVSQRMRRARPIIENAWIGGIFSNGNWSWVTTSEPINVSNTTRSPDEPIAWYRPDEIIMDGCLLADRHVCDHFVYVEAKCSRRRNFICEKEEEVKPSVPLVPVKNSSLWVSTYDDTWIRAQHACRICVKGQLVHLNSTKVGMTKQLDVLFTTMALTLKEELRHVWIGGYLYKTTWKWVNDTNHPPRGSRAITYEEFERKDWNGEKGSITFSRVDYKKDSFLLNEKCLNLDREQQKYFFMYGLDCLMKQFFICQASEVIAKLGEGCLQFWNPTRIIN